MHHNRTIIERICDDLPQNIIWQSKSYPPVVAVVFDQPTLPYQVVIARRHGIAGKKEQLFDLDQRTQAAMLEVARIIGNKILQYCGPRQRVVMVAEGFGIPDHAHLMLGIATEEQAQHLFRGDILGEWAVQQTLESIAFTHEEAVSLEKRVTSSR